MATKWSLSSLRTKKYQSFTIHLKI